MTTKIVFCKERELMEEMLDDMALEGLEMLPVRSLHLFFSSRRLGSCDRITLLAYNQRELQNNLDSKYKRVDLRRGLRCFSDLPDSID